jgi:hypothetical protein
LYVKLNFTYYNASTARRFAWVYNRADINGAKVVWAREMDEADNRELLQYFHDRRAWLVEADENPPKLSPYK